MRTGFFVWMIRAVLAPLGVALGCVGADVPGPVTEATLTVHAAERGQYRIPREITGKFCEHLGANIYNGMDAQILKNSTFADFPIWSGQMSPDGITTFLYERERIDADLRRQASRFGWPEAEIHPLLDARAAGLATFWSRVGPAEAVEPSPDTGPGGGRAQRLQLKAGAGIKQWTWLPLHRTRKYEFELLVRSREVSSLKLSLSREGEAPCATAPVDGISPEWQSLKGTFAVPADSPSDVPYRVELSAAKAGQVVLGHFFLWPADHVNGADPDVIRLLRESRLPLLRWPGGNFVSAYHWEDGIGPVAFRPTKPNYAWGGVEPNTFGTDEFIAFCRAVGCEPMICINAGTGTPEEAARWIEYCNGATDSPGGARRAKNGHPEPFRVRHWEVGNELWGKWQAHWTTAEGYVDRYNEFATAMLKADPAIRLHACGAPVLWGKAWNDTLISGAAARFQSITDHPLVGGNVGPETEPLDVYRDFMYVPALLERKWAALRGDMERGQIRDPRLAVTELQMFAHLGGGRSDATPKLTHGNLVSPSTLAEALYDTLIYHAAVRLQPFVEMVTHSATVNHGGGLRKERERVYPNPCHYANALFANFADAVPVKTELACSTEQAPLVLPEVKNAVGQRVPPVPDPGPEMKDRRDALSYGVVDALGARTRNGDLLLSIVNRGTKGPLKLKVLLDGIRAARARIETLSGPEPWAGNTLEKPDAIRPVASELNVSNGQLELELAPYSLVQLTLPLS